MGKGRPARYRKSKNKMDKSSAKMGGNHGAQKALGSVSLGRRAPSTAERKAERETATHDSSHR